MAIIQFLTPFLEKIEDRKLKKEPTTVYEKIFAVRGKANPSYPTQQQYDTKLEFLKESINDGDAIGVISEFCRQVFRITANNTKVTDQLSFLFADNSDLLNSQFVALKARGFTLTSLFDIILSDNSFSDDNILLTEHVLKYKDKGIRRVGSAALQSKITTLIDNVLNSSITGLIGRVVSDDEIKDAVVFEIVNRDSSFINALPKSLLDLAIAAFSRETSSNYLENYDYLRVVAEKGSTSQKTEIVRILHPNITNNKDIDATISVFEKLNVKNRADRNLIIAALEKHLESITSEESEEKVKIEALVQKFKVKE